MNLKKLNRAETLAYCAIGISILTLLITLFRSEKASIDMEPATTTTEQEIKNSNVAARTVILEDTSRTSAEVAKLAAASVVRVEVSFDTQGNPENDLETFFGSLPRENLGSGVVVDTQGFVVTNYHVVRGAQTIAVSAADGIAHQAKLVGSDALTDLALLHVKDLVAPVIRWADSDRTQAGEFVWAVGNPYGLDQSVSMGIISSTNRPNMLDSPFQDFLQTDASINPGNSGGALVNARGHLVGINTAIAGDTFQGISFALPSNTAKQVIQQLQDNGHIARGWIGVQLGPVTAARAALANLENNLGAYVEALGDGDVPAFEAGLRVGDIVVNFAGKPVTGPLHLLRQIAGHPVNMTAKLSVKRNQDMIDLEVEVAERPEPIRN